MIFATKSPFPIYYSNEQYKMQTNHIFPFISAAVMFNIIQIKNLLFHSVPLRQGYNSFYNAPQLKGVTTPQSRSSS